MSQLKTAMAGARPAKDIEPQALETAPVSAPVVPSYEIGAGIKGEGIFAGVWQPLIREKYVGLWQPIDLTKSWLVFVAPEDLGHKKDGTLRVWTFYGAANEIASRRKWHGHDGFPCYGEGELHQALIDKRYNGGWFIPPLGLLRGVDIEGATIHADSLYANRLKGNFSLKTGIDSKNRKDLSGVFYWSCAHARLGNDRMHVVDFRNGKVDADSAREVLMNCRPVRLKEWQP